jgi:hypothetical protein
VVLLGATTNAGLPSNIFSSGAEHWRCRLKDKRNSPDC